MAFVPVSSFPVAVGLSGAEEVPCIQGGVTKRTTVGAIATFPVTSASFVTASANAGLDDERVLTQVAGETVVTDNGANSTITVGLASTITAAGPIGDSTHVPAITFDAKGRLTTVTSVAIAASGTVNSGTAGQISWYATTGTAVSGNANANISNGALTLGQPTAVMGQLLLAGSTSGTATITPQATSGSPTLTLPNASGTIAVSATVPLVLSATTGNLTITSAALTKTDDTNVTLTLGGTPTTALLAATSLTLGWTGQLGVTRGGTSLSSISQGDLIYGSAANTFSALAKSASSSRFLSNQGTSNNPSWAQVTAGDIGSGAALTRTDDTNVTLTLGGSPTTALLAATSITAGWTGQLGLTRGGTAASLTASNGGLVYSTASALAILSGTATANQLLLSGASAAPTWSTLTHPSTAAAGTVLAAGTANVLSATATPTLGAASSATGAVLFKGTTSGTVTFSVADAAGTYTFKLPTSAGSNTNVLQTDGSGNTSWASAGSGTVTSIATSNGLTGGTITTTGTLSVLGIVPSQLRLTLVTATPVMTTTQTAKTSIFLTPYLGTYLPSYNGTNTLMVSTGGEVSLALDSNAGHTGYQQSGKNFDLFWDDAGSRLVSGPAWSSDTARATALEYKNGFLCNAASMTAKFDASASTATISQDRGLYLGTMRASADGQTQFVFGALAAGGTAGSFLLWNMYNRVIVGSMSRDSTDSWTYGTATYRASNNSTGMRTSYVCGTLEDSITARYNVDVQPPAGSNAYVSIGVDAVNAIGGTASFANSNPLSNVIYADYVGYPGLGFHFVSAIEAADAANATFFGDNGGSLIQNGFVTQFRM